jgi:hypothetical protein
MSVNQFSSKEAAEAMVQYSEDIGLIVRHTNENARQLMVSDCRGSGVSPLIP